MPRGTSIAVRSSRVRSLAMIVLCAWVLEALVATGAAGAEGAGPRVTPLDLPFRATAMRGPGSEVALSAATSGLSPVARRPPASADPKARPAKSGDDGDASETPPVAVVWGEGGGAVLSLAEGRIRTTLVRGEAIEGIAVSETARGAVPGTRRALAGRAGRARHCGACAWRARCCSGVVARAPECAIR